MPEEIKNPVLRNLIDRRDAETRSREFYENQIRYQAETIGNIRRQFKTDLDRATEKLREMEKALQITITAVNRWEAAIRALHTLRIAGDPNAICAIGTEEPDETNSKPAV
jgi:hypothetical protein